MGRIIYGTKRQDDFFAYFKNGYHITDELICDLFARSLKGEPQFYTDDLITIGPKDSKFVKDGSITTIGCFLYNKIILEDMEVFGYLNKTLKGSFIDKIDDAISTALRKDLITTEQYARYIDRSQYLFGGTLSNVINSTISRDVLNLPPKATKLKAKLMAENREAMAAGDPLTASKIEKEVCAVAKEEIRTTDPESMDLFDSECGVSFDNNYKTMFVMKGAIQDNTGLYPSGYKVVASDYDNGISKEDYPKFADSLVTSAYSKGKLTAISGYSTKKYNSMFQDVRLDVRGSDCKTARTRKVLLTKDNADDYVTQGRYIVVSGKPVLLTDDNISAFIGKTVNMRTPLYCEAKDGDYCNICHGELKYILGIRNIGLTFNMASNAMMNANMKKFHDITIKLHQIDIDKDIMRFVN